MKLLIIFITLNIVNVILQTIKSLATVKCGKTIAAIVNAIAYSLYTVVLIFTNADFPMWQKCLIVGATNFVGVYVVKAIEEKVRMDKLWLVKMSIPTSLKDNAKNLLRENQISFTELLSENIVVFDCYCATQNETTKVLNVAKACNGKTFATENKLF